MLKKRQRLSRSEFAHLLKHGKRVHGTHCTILYTPTPTTVDPTTTKCGVVVGKKIARKAVTRHQVRRNVYTVLGGLLPTLAGHYVAVLTKPAIASCDLNELTEEITKLTKQIPTV